MERGLEALRKLERPFARVGPGCVETGPNPWPSRQRPLVRIAVARASPEAEDA